MRKWLTQTKADQHPNVVAFDYPPGLPFPRVDGPATFCPVIPKRGEPYFYFIEMHPGSEPTYQVQTYRFGADERDLVRLDTFLEQVGSPWSPFSLNGEMFFPEPAEGPRHFLQAIVDATFVSKGLSRLGDICQFLGQRVVINGAAFLMLCELYGVDPDAEQVTPIYSVQINGEMRGYAQIDPADGPDEALMGLLYRSNDLVRPQERYWEFRDDPGLYLSGDHQEQEFTLGWSQLDPEQLEQWNQGEREFPDDLEGGEDVTIAVFRRV